MVHKVSSEKARGAYRYESVPIPSFVSISWKGTHTVGERVGGRMGPSPASGGVLGSRAPLRRAIPPLGLEHLVID